MSSLLKLTSICKKTNVVKISGNENKKAHKEPFCLTRTISHDYSSSSTRVIKEVLPPDAVVSMLTVFSVTRR